MLNDPITRIHSVMPRASGAGSAVSQSQNTLPASMAIDAHSLEVLESWIGAPVCYMTRDLTVQFASQSFWALVAQPTARGPISIQTLLGATNWAVIRPYLERAAEGRPLVLTATHGEQHGVDALSVLDLRPHFSESGDVQGVLIALHRGNNGLDLPSPVLELLPQAMAHLDRGAAPIWANRAFRNLFTGDAGSENRMTQRPFPELRELMRRAGAREPVRRELLSATPEGERWLRFDLTLAAIDGALEAGAYVVVTDVHETHLAALKAGDSQLHQFADNVPEAIAFLDMERQYRYANRAFLELSGKRVEEVIGHTVPEVLGPAFALRRADLFNLAWTGTATSYEAADQINGVAAWREVRYLPSLAADGSVEGIYLLARSIDESKSTEIALADQQSRIRTLTDHLPAQISYLNVDFRYEYCNQQFLADNGLSEDDVIGHTPSEVFGQAIGAETLGHVSRAIQGEHVQFERRSAPTAPEPRWSRVSVVGDFDTAGVCRGTYGIAFDITETRLAQEDLQKQQAWIESFIESFPQPLNYLNPEGVYSFANVAFCRIAGKSKAEIVGKSARDILPPGLVDDMVGAFRTALRGATFRSEHELPRGQDSYHWIAIDWLPDRDAAGEIKGVYTLTQDISKTKQAQLDYEASVRELQRAMDSVALPISHVDREQRIRFVNRTTTIWHGRRPEELIGLSLKDLLSTDDYAFARPYVEAALSGQLVQYEREMRYHDGIRRWVLLRYVPTRDEAGTVTGFYTTATDIQARKKQELALQQANWLLSAHFENTPLASFTLNADMAVTRWSSQAEMLFGWHRDDVLERSFWHLGLVETDHMEDFFPHSELQTTQTDSRRHVALACRRDGTRVACEWHLAALRDSLGRITSVLGLVQDVSQRVEAENRLLESAQRDTLTMLLNRNALDPTLRGFIERAKRDASGVAVLFIDLDHFKNINDTLGHRVGDLMLIEIAATLKRCIRPDDEVARIGGDEFMVILGHDRPKAIAHEVAERIIHALREPLRVENQRLSVAASIGVAVYPDHGRTPDSLLRSADLAMYRAKENGKNRFEFFSAALAQRSERRTGIKNALKQALHRDALKLYYQPRVSIADGRMVGAEALLRWTDDQLGIVSPKEFISIAEESGLIHELGLFVFRKACRQLRDWQDRGLDMGMISINFSAHQLLVATFVDEVDRVIDETGCDPRTIEVEITETSMLFDLGVTKNVISELKHRGMQIAIDDFGTGFSSLSHLQQLDIDTLKIDQSFIRDMLDDPGDLAITRSVISMGRGLGLSVTAEGVENERQLAALRAAGCDCYQGFHFSPAIAIEDLEMMMEENRRR